MKPGLHLFIATSAQMLLPLASLIVIAEVFKKPIMAFVSIFIVWILVRLFFKFVIHAKCPECGGKSKYGGRRPVTYTCLSCSHVHYTKINEGSRSPFQ